MGPLISDEQFDKVLGYLDSGREAGAEAVVGGERAGRPRLLRAADGPHQHQPDMKVEREEIFGPVVCAIPFDSPEEIVPVANDTNYGLAAGVFTRDISKAHRTAKRLRAGTVWINTYHVFDAAMPFGGYKESGWGREMGSQVLEQLPRDQVGRHGALGRATRMATSARLEPTARAGRRRPRRRRRYVPGHPGAPRTLAASRPAGAARRGRPRLGRPPRREDWSGERPRAGRRGAAQVDARAPALAQQFVRGRALRVLERGAATPPGCPPARSTFETLGRRAGGGRAPSRGRRAGIAPSPQGSASPLQRPQLPARARLPELRRALTSPGADAARVHARTSRRSRARGRARRARRDPRLDAEHGRPPTYRDWTPSRACPGAGRPRARAGRARPWSARATATAPTRGTRRSWTPASRRAYGAGRRRGALGAGRLLDADRAAARAADLRGAPGHGPRGRRCAPLRRRGGRLARARPGAARGRCLTRGRGASCRTPGAPAPAWMAAVARLRGIELWVAPAGGPSQAGQLGALVVLSGAAGARDLVAEAVDERVPVLAIGPGARLLAATLGAPTRPGIGGSAMRPRRST